MNDQNFFELLTKLNQEQISDLLDYAIKLKEEELKDTVVIDC